jgi:hypothetical protein
MENTKNEPLWNFSNIGGTIFRTLANNSLVVLDISGGGGGGGGVLPDICDVFLPFLLISFPFLVFYKKWD